MQKTGDYRPRIKLCGLTRPCDIEAANELKPDYIGFVFAQKSRRYVSAQRASELKKLLHPDILAVGVFVDESPDVIAGLLNSGIIEIAQLHGGENEAYIKKLRKLTDKPIWKAFRIDGFGDIAAAQESSADLVLLDSGSGGMGKTFDWSLIQALERPYFLAGGMRIDNVKAAIEALNPYGVDVSSGIETDGGKDRKKMKEFVCSVRTVQGKDEIT